MDHLEPLLTTKELAVKLHTSRQAVNRLALLNHIPSIKIPGSTRWRRFLYSDVIHALKTYQEDRHGTPQLPQLVYRKEA